MTKEVSFNTLKHACQELMDSKLILTSRKLTDILRVIAASRALIKVVSDSMSGFNYLEEYERSFYKTDSNKLDFKLPENPRIAVALVVNMLYDFDSGALNFVEFIENSFYGIRTEDRYKTFCKIVITPFLDNMHALLFETAPPVVMKKHEKVDEEIFLTNDALRDKADIYLKQLHFLTDKNILPAIITAADPSKSSSAATMAASQVEDKNQTVHYMIDGLAYALEQRNNRYIKVAFIGLKALLFDKPEFDKPLSEINQLLRLYSVL